ncbi:hypothetical protein ACFWC5_32525 [Streptomyces sp. NPDC060085]|uniref:hypothetical protein n=1 Tax=Streptomyces sp. NPDC060085 TaxID=3347054 RepID=UPI0036488CF4
MSDTNDNRTLQAHYATQVTSDLDRNVKEQEDVESQLSILESKLDQLKQDQKLLIIVRNAVSAANGSMDLQKDSGELDGNANRTAFSKKRETIVSNNSPQTLPQLVLHQLARRSADLVSAADVTQAVQESNPQRSTNVVLVRNALEALVARGTVARTKRQRYVYYSLRT